MIKHLTIKKVFTAWMILLLRTVNARPSTTPRPVYKIRVEVQHDTHPQETAWTLSNMGTGEFLLSQSQGWITQQNAFIYQEVYVEAGAFRFDIADSFPDGICCSSGFGWYRLIIGNDVVLFGDGNFGSSDSKQFIITGNGEVIETDTDPQPPLREYRLEVQYPPTGQGETRVKVVKNNQNVVMFDRSPDTRPGEYRSEPVVLIPGETYKLVLVDSASNGMPGGYAFVSMYENGVWVQNLAWIGGNEFTFKGREDFFVPYKMARSSSVATTRTGGLRGNANHKVYCEDTNGTFVLRGEEHNCDWIELYWPQSASFCDLDTVEEACRKTCRRCDVKDKDDEDGNE